MDGNWWDDPEAEIERPGKNPPAKRRKREPGPAKTRTTRAERAAPPAKDTRCGVRKQNGQPCTLMAGYGTSHPGYGPCRHHFGDTPAGRKNGAHNMAEELMVFYGEPIDTDPVNALLDEVKRTAGHVAWLSKTIGSFGFSVIDPDSEDKIPNEIPPEVLGYLALYNSERQQLVRVSKAALDAGVNERLVQLAEHQGLRMADAVNQILDALALTEQQRALVPRVVPDILRGLMNNDSPRLIEGTIEEQL